MEDGEKDHLIRTRQKNLKLAGFEKARTEIKDRQDRYDFFSRPGMSWKKLFRLFKKLFPACCHQCLDLFAPFLKITLMLLIKILDISFEIFFRFLALFQQDKLFMKGFRAVAPEINTTVVSIEKKPPGNRGIFFGIELKNNFRPFHSFTVRKVKSARKGPSGSARKRQKSRGVIGQGLSVKSAEETYVMKAEVGELIEEFLAAVETRPSSVATPSMPFSPEDGVCSWVVRKPFLEPA